ncbi:hypothetical protein Hdeb2414_s0006g00209201 [Helianthus debilis subsp. tardiflorus]
MEYSVFKLLKSGRIDFNTFKVAGGIVSVNLSMEVEEHCEHQGTEEEEVCSIGTPIIHVRLSINAISGVFGSGCVDLKKFKAGPVILSFKI